MKKIVKLYPQTICNMLCEKKNNFWIMEFSCHWPLAPAVQESTEKLRQFIFSIV